MPFEPIIHAIFCRVVNQDLWCATELVLYSCNERATSWNEEVPFRRVIELKGWTRHTVTATAWKLATQSKICKEVRVCTQCFSPLLYTQFEINSEITEYNSTFWACHRNRSTQSAGLHCDTLAPTSPIPCPKYQTSKQTNKKKNNYSY